MQYDLFVSYAEADRAWVEGYLLDTLQAADVCCIVESAFALGAPRVEEFERAVRESRRTLLVLSPAYLTDDIAKFVDILAQSYGLESTTWPVIPLVLHPVKLPTRLAMLTGLDATDTKKQGQAIARLLADLHKPLPLPATKLPCPYPGMKPFSEAEAARFFGREREVQDLLNQLRLHPFVAVIGPSGSGKSSLVFAGLLPKLRTTSLFGADEWQIKVMRPGSTPASTLAQTLGVPDPRAFQSEQRTLLVVDQFEELFALAPQEAIGFVSALSDLVAARIYVVLTVRSDFYSDLMASPLWPDIRAHRVEVTPLDAEGLRQAVIHPAESTGVFVETALVERLIADAANEPGILPLVQETLVLLWDKLERRYLPLRAYEALVQSLPRNVRDRSGAQPDPTRRTGLQVAMALQANDALAELKTEQQQTIARRIFLRLVQFGEGRADTRRQQTVAQLRAIGDNSADFEHTLQHFVSRRLLTLRTDATDEIQLPSDKNAGYSNRDDLISKDARKRVDLAHEALITGWPMLQTWLVERRDAELGRRRLEAKASEWVRLGRGSAGLLDLTELKEAEQWQASRDAAELGISTDLDALITTSLAEVNPGWHRIGTPGLIVVGLGIVALIVLTYMTMLENGLNETALVMACVFGMALLGLAVLAFIVSRRSDPRLAQRISHALGNRRSFQWVAVAFTCTVVVLWGVFGAQLLSTDRACTTQGYQKPTILFTPVAVVTRSGVSPAAANVFGLTLEEASGGDIKSWIFATREDTLPCKAFFRFRVLLTRQTDVNSTNAEATYTANIETVAGDVFGAAIVNASTQRMIGADTCAMFEYLANKVANSLMFDPPDLYDGVSLPEPSTCEPLVANLEGNRARRARQYEDAAQRYQQALELYPDFARAHNGLGIAYYRMGRAIEGVREVRTANALAPKYVSFAISLISACTRLEDWSCAEDAARRAVTLDPNSFIAYANMSIVYRQQGKYTLADAALNNAEQLITRAPNPNAIEQNRHALLKNRGVLYFAEGRRQQAKNILEDARNLGERLFSSADDPYREEIMFYLAKLREIENAVEACRLWRDYLMIPPSAAYNETVRRSEATSRLKALSCP